MPSPIGHALGGICAGWDTGARQNLRDACILAAVAIAPDLDLFVGDHRSITHSIGAAAAAGLVALVATRRPRWAMAVALAWGSHILLDWLSNDTRPPIGVMALWPFSRDYYKAPIEIFPAVSRRYWETRFWIYNAKALLVEVAILGPLAAWTVKSPRRTNRAPAR